MLPNVPPNLQGMDPIQKEAWDDVQSRASMAKNLILDTNAGMLDMMVSSTHVSLKSEVLMKFQVSSTYKQSGEPPAFGDEILTIARRL